MSAFDKNTKRDIMWFYVGYFITFVFQLISRTIVICSFCIRCLNLSSLFTSIIQVLNVLKHGFSNTVVCSMYKLIIEKM
jgi:hypothetical protein